MLPDGWSQKSLEQISIGKLTNGAFNDPKLVGSGYRLINVVDLYNPLYIDVSNLKRLAIPKKEFEKYKAVKGDLFFTRSSLKLDGIAHCARLTGDFDDIIYDCHIMRLRCNHDEIDSNFLYEYCNSYPARKHFMRYAKTGTMTTIDQAGVSTLVVPLPPLPEQKKIAQILSTWDNAISATERLLENSQQRKKALMQQLLTGKKRLPGFEGEWKNGSLKDIASISKGKALSSKDLIEGDYPVIAGGKTSPYNHKDFTHENVVTVSASGAYAGYVALHPYKFWASDCSVVEAKKFSDINFIYYFMVWKQSRIYSLQSGGAQPHIYPKDLHVLHIDIPDKDEQQAIANVLTTADQEIEALQKRLDYLKLEKKALMQQLLTGKRRVQVEEAA